MARRDISFQTEHGRDEDGRRIYTAEEYQGLEDQVGRLSDRDFKDWVRAPAEGRIRSEDEAESSEAGAGGMENMSAEERAKVLNRPSAYRSSSSEGDTSSSEGRSMEDMSPQERARELNGRSW